MRQLILAGDSTCAFNAIDTYPQTGWGQVLDRYLDFNHIRVINAAANGRSSKSFIDEGRLKAIEQQMQPGDFLCIQFGHNDQKTDDERHTEPLTTYPKYLKRYIDCARKKGATPILITSVYRRYFNADGTIMDQVHQGYPEAMMTLAQQEGVLCMDLCQMTKEWLSVCGEQISRSYFVPQDNTHLVYDGAIHVAGFVIQALEANHVDLPYRKQVTLC